MKTILTLILLASTANAQTEKQVYVMATDPAPPGTEYALLAKDKIIILIPPTTAVTVGDTSTERELIASFVRLNFIFTGRMRVLFPPRWFEFEDINTKKRYRFFENDKTTITALFADGSTVQFGFIGTAIQCPSGQCFEWQVGTETRPLIRVPRDTRSGVRPPHPGTAGGAPSVGLVMVHYRLTKPYNPYALPDLQW